MIHDPLGPPALGGRTLEFLTEGGPEHHQAGEVTRQRVAWDGPGLLNRNERLIGFGLGRQTGGFASDDRGERQASTVAGLHRV
jgi:hypothetical protein